MYICVYVCIYICMYVCTDYFDSTVGLTIILNNSSAVKRGFTALGNAVLLRLRGGLLSRGTSFAPKYV